MKRWCQWRNGGASVASSISVKLLWLLLGWWWSVVIQFTLKKDAVIPSGLGLESLWIEKVALFSSLSKTRAVNMAQPSLDILRLLCTTGQNGMPPQDYWQAHSCWIQQLGRVSIWFPVYIQQMYFLQRFSKTSFSFAKLSSDDSAKPCPGEWSTSGGLSSAFWSWIGWTMCSDPKPNSLTVGSL